jgi:hypothetical protein
MRAPIKRRRSAFMREDRLGTHTCAALRCCPYFGCPGVETSMSACCRPGASWLASAMRMLICVEPDAEPRLDHPGGTTVRASCGTAIALAPSVLELELSRPLALAGFASVVHWILAWRMTVARAAHAMMRAAEGAMREGKDEARWRVRAKGWRRILYRR